MKELAKGVARGVIKVGDYVYRNGKKFVVVGFTAAGAAICQAQTDATVIATNAQTAFAVMADVGRKSSGLPLWLIPIMGIAAIVALIYGVKFGVRYVSGVFKGNKKPASSMVTNAVPTSASRSAAVPTAVGDLTAASPAPVPNMPLPGRETNEIGCVGWAVVNGSVLVFLTDGTTAESDHGEVDFIDVKGRRVGVGGKVYRRVKRPAFSEAPRYEQQGGPVPSLYSRPDPPVNDAIILPTIHSAGDGLRAQRLNGIENMGGQSQQSTKR